MIIWSKLYSIEVNQAKLCSGYVRRSKIKSNFYLLVFIFIFFKLDGTWFLYKSYDNFPVRSHFENPPLLQNNFL